MKEQNVVGEGWSPTNATLTTVVGKKIQMLLIAIERRVRKQGYIHYLIGAQ